MPYQVCPKCNKSREVYERIETKDGKSWLITYCIVCKWNFDIQYVDTKRKARRFKFSPFETFDDDGTPID